ncbi:beta-lactamase domain protein [Hippea maritima DSM 10411]|uniref:Beta-lactamase domain protein n=2 Tax=Hippea TaxID=84404 RepID=F2LVE3_HIPMA|nr:MBL fold metallo-hydrolase [Hippea maritima]AEA33727.1 beta-lactamase domain protein [Hippea maritima DSM 10411]
MGEYNNKPNSEIDMENGEILYDDGKHKFIWLGWGRLETGLIQTNQYLIIDGNKGVLLDPGGIHIFPKVVANVTKYIDLDDIDVIFFSHQDPDVSSGIPMWLSVTNANVYISDLWVRFLPHFGITDFSRIKGIPDGGQRLGDLEVIPAHFMHSPGNHIVFDSKSKILFNADIGAAVFNEGGEYLFVDKDNFNAHTALMEGFHKRYIASSNACRYYVNKVRSLSPKMIAPQHGGVFRDEAVEMFLNWLGNLKCGTDIIDELSR